MTNFSDERIRSSYNSNVESYTPPEGCKQALMVSLNGTKFACTGTPQAQHWILSWPDSQLFHSTSNSRNTMRGRRSVRSLLELYHAFALPKYIEKLVASYIIHMSSQVRREVCVVSQNHNLNVRDASYSAIWMVRALVTLSFRKQCLRFWGG